MLFVLEISFTNFISFINFIEWIKSIDKKSKILTKLHINVSIWNIRFLLVYVYLLKLFSNSRSLTPMCILMIAPWNLYICVTNVHTWILTLYLFFSHIIYTFKVAFDFTYRWVCMRVYTHFSPWYVVNRKCAVYSWSLVPLFSVCKDPLCIELLRKILQFQIGRKDIYREIIALLATLVSLG